MQHGASHTAAILRFPQGLSKAHLGCPGYLTLQSSFAPLWGFEQGTGSYAHPHPHSLMLVVGLVWDVGKFPLMVTAAGWGAPSLLGLVLSLTSVLCADPPPRVDKHPANPPVKAEATE